MAQLKKLHGDIEKGLKKAPGMRSSHAQADAEAEAGAGTSGEAEALLGGFFFFGGGGSGFFLSCGKVRSGGRCWVFFFGSRKGIKHVQSTQGGGVVDVPKRGTLGFKSTGKEIGPGSCPRAKGCLSLDMLF